MVLEDSFALMAKIGILDVVLPFVLVFTLTYALFKRTKVFGRMNKRTSIIVALVTAFLFVGLFSFENFMWMLFWMVIVFVAFLFYILLVQTMGLETKVNGFVIGSVFLIFALIGSYQFIDINRLIRFVFNPFVVTILLFVLLLWFIVHEKSTNAEKKSDEKKENKEEKPKDENKEKNTDSKEYTPPADLPRYKWEEVERIPGEKFKEKYKKEWDKAEGEF